MPADPNSLLLVGVDHRTSPAELRDRFALIEGDLEGALEQLRRGGAGEAVLIATCDRIELLSHEAETIGAFVALVASRTSCAAESVTASLYRHEGAAALRHLFTVASALDSLVIGEPQVLGQVKAAHRTAAELGLVGGALENAFAGAFACARRIRRETRIAERPVSLAAAALDLAREIHGALERSSLLLIGPSEMAELMAEQFRRGGVQRISVCGPPERARLAAQRFGANVAPLEALDEELAGADIVVAALGSGRAVLTAAKVAAALRRRRTRPIFVIDVAIPPDAEPAINEVDGAFLYDLADLERAAMAGRADRAAAAGEARVIVEDELESFRARRAARRAVPAVVALRRHFERLRDEVMAGGLDADAATRLLVNRLLHTPSEVLRDLAARQDDAAAMEALLRRLFRLEGDEDK
jgi:glutamyl-tRNA reductase